MSGISDQSKIAEQEGYRTNGYVLLTALFPKPIMLAFHQRLQNDLDLSRPRAFLTQTHLTSKQSIEVYSMQYPPIATFLWGLTPRMAEVAGCELMPSYAYFRVYQQGDVCFVHSDREACEHSLSLTVELADDLPWALSLEQRHVDLPEPSTDPDFGSEDYVSLPMGAGDAVMYRGVNHRHGRLEPNPNRWSAHLFMHWVDAKGPYADHAFDRVALERLGVKSP